MRFVIRDDKPKSNDEAKRPKFKVCKFTTDAIVTEGSDIGTVHKVRKRGFTPDQVYFNRLPEALAV